MLAPPAEILIVDDNPANLDVLTRVLRGRNHRVRTVTSGAMALEAMRLAPPELVLLDISMPEMDGFSVREAMRLDPTLEAIPVIFISALDAPMDKVRAFEIGGRDYITKPFAPEEVVARVEHHASLVRLQKEREAQNHALAEANLKLREVQTLKANFTAMLAHDLRSPLTSMALVLDSLREGIPLKAETLARAEEAYDRVRRLIDEMLELYRCEQADVSIRSSELDPTSWLHSLGCLFAERAAERGIQFEERLPENLPTFRGEKEKLDRVFHNLLDNAIKFTPAGGAVRLEAGVTYGSDVEAGLRFLRVGVSDTGRGIPPERLPFIFDPFRQVEARDATHGFGLGLAIVQRLVAAHRGQIHAQSQVGCGTNFTVLLPC